MRTVEKKLTIAGAGISGISLAQSVRNRLQVSLLEKSDKPGGLIKCDLVKGSLYHKVGGHVFNTKNREVFDWFWSFFDQEEEFLKAKRNAKILMAGQIIGYPLEHYLYQLDQITVSKVIEELLCIERSKNSFPPAFKNFEDFLKQSFGPTLYSIYFKPYNNKLWNTDLSTIPLEWLEGKLPMPNVKDILLRNITKEEENEMPHSSFFYPKEGGSQFIADRLCKGLSITYNTPLHSIARKHNSLILNDHLKSDILVYTGDVRQLGSILHPWSDELGKALKSVEHLKSNGTSTILCECDKNDISWLYLPEAFTRAHRIIYTGNFSEANSKGTKRETCVVEFSGKVDVATMVQEIKKLPGNLNALECNYEPNSYIIQEGDTRKRINALKNLLEPFGIFLLGRFAEWEYYNMDKAIEAAFSLSKKINTI